MLTRPSVKAAEWTSAAGDQGQAIIDAFKGN